MDIDELLNALTALNGQVNLLIARIETLEANAPEKGEYFNQVLASFEETEDCELCYVNPAVCDEDGDCGCSP